MQQQLANYANATQQQLANYANAPTAPPMPALPFPAAYTPNVQRQCGQRSRVRTQYQPPGTRAPAYPAPHMPFPHVQGIPAPLPFVPLPTNQQAPQPYTPNPQAPQQHTPLGAAPTFLAPATTRPRGSPPNPNKQFNNHNYCYSCGFDVPAWHTSATCPTPNAHHQAGCTRENVAQYAAAGHNVSRRAVHKTVMPINPPPHLA